MASPSEQRRGTSGNRSAGEMDAQDSVVHIRCKHRFITMRKMRLLAQRRTHICLVSGLSGIMVGRGGVVIVIPQRIHIRLLCDFSEWIWRIAIRRMVGERRRGVSFGKIRHVETTGSGVSSGGRTQGARR